jgi:DNA-binding MarR family transcriptional regulator
MKNTRNNQQNESLGALINRAAYCISHDLNQRVRQMGLDMTVWTILRYLWQQDGVPQARISELIGRPEYSTSRAIDRLETSGLVARRHDPCNRRVRLVFLTDAGRASQASLAPLAESTNEKVMGQLTGDEQEQLMSLLRKIIGAL